MARQLGTALGWFSVVLGAVQAIVPEAVLRLVGIEPRDGRVRTMRVVGARELAGGVPLLVDRHNARWLAARLGGDAMDIGLLVRALASRDVRRGRIVLAIAAVLGVTALDAVALIRRGGPSATERVTRAVTVNRSPDEVYRHWRALENLPAFMAHLESVEERGGGRSHWVATGPGGTRVEWDAEITEDRPGELLAWRSVPGSGVENEGTVRFVAVRDGTEVHVEMSYRPPAGPIGAAVAALFGEEPQQQVSDDLRRFKQVMEVGEVIRSDATDARRRLAQRPAQPPAESPDAVGARAASADDRMTGASGTGA